MVAERRRLAFFLWRKHGVMEGVDAMEKFILQVTGGSEWIGRWLRGRWSD